MTLINASRWRVQAGAGVTTLVSGELPIVARTLEAAQDPAAYRHAEGPFACAVHDALRGETILVRDHFGQQPCYYCRDGNHLIVGDTLPDILQHLPRRPAWNTREIEAITDPASAYSDDTICVGISRVEPGHILHLRSDRVVSKRAFWSLDPHAQSLVGLDDEEVLERFSTLLADAVRHATAGDTAVASEFSAGLDSTAVVAAANALAVPLSLFMHTPVADSPEDRAYDRRAEQVVLERLGIPSATVHRIGVDPDPAFDPVSAMAFQARLFAGPAPYLFTVFAQPLLQAVGAARHTVLLSGFGGDQGVSGSVPDRFGARSRWRDVLRPLSDRLTRADRGRAFEGDRLQGPGSREIRLRIESSAIVARALGFTYRYPLLSPRLLEFYVSLPADQKRRGRVGRLLMRRYLARILGDPVFDQQDKRTSLPILPATLPGFMRQIAAGKGVAAFDRVRDARDPGEAHRRLVAAMRDYMMASV